MPGRFVRSNLVLADFGTELSHTGPGFRGLWGPSPRASQPCLPLRPFTHRLTRFATYVRPAFLFNGMFPPCSGYNSDLGASAEVICLEIRSRFIMGEMSKVYLPIKTCVWPLAASLRPGRLGSPRSAAQPGRATATWGREHASFCPLVPQGLWTPDGLHGTRASPKVIARPQCGACAQNKTERGASTHTTDGAQSQG